jgi:hypothetical protein
MLPFFGYHYKKNNIFFWKLTLKKVFKFANNLKFIDEISLPKNSTLVNLLAKVSATKFIWKKK